jgi:hypothetical protein
VPDVQARLALDDPFRDDLADATRPGDAVRAEAGGDEEAPTSVSPRQNSLSGVNASGPLTIIRTPMSAMSGTRICEFCAICSNRGQFSGSSRPLKSAGTAS